MLGGDILSSLYIKKHRGFPGGSDGKELASNAGNLGLILGREDPLEKGMATHSSNLAWESHGQKGSLMGYSPWSCTVRLH